jgi:hypothetical protein
LIIYSDRTKKQRSGTTCKEAAQEKNVPKDNEQAEVEKEPFCSYSMMWNSKTGNLFESGQHTNHEMPKRIKLKNEWHLLESESGKDISIEAILARFSVKVSGKMTGHYWFKCNRCDGLVDYLFRKVSEMNLIFYIINLLFNQNLIFIFE